MSDLDLLESTISTECSALMRANSAYCAAAAGDIAAATWFHRYALEKEIRAAGDSVPHPNVLFDETGHFILVPTYLGIKV